MKVESVYCSSIFFNHLPHVNTHSETGLDTCQNVVIKENWKPMMRFIARAQEYINNYKIATSFLNQEHRDFIAQVRHSFHWPYSTRKKRPEQNGLVFQILASRVSLPMCPLTFKSFSSKSCGDTESSAWTTTVLASTLVSTAWTPVQNKKKDIRKFPIDQSVPQFRNTHLRSFRGLSWRLRHSHRYIITQNQTGSNVSDYRGNKIIGQADR